MSRIASVVAAMATLVSAACGPGPVSVPSPSGPPSTSVVSPSPTLAADWVEYHGSSARTGMGPATPALSHLGQAWGAQLDGDVYASPLIVAGHVLAATENNSVYALDLFTGAPVWKAHLGEPVAASALPCGDIEPVTGITSTPAADTTTGRLYVVAFLRGFHHVLFTLSLTDGSVISQQVVDPAGSRPEVQQQRGALAIGSGRVYVTLGGLYGDCGTYHGYVVAVPTGAGATALYRTPVDNEAGIWSAAGPTITESGAVYVVTGNGSPTQSFGYSNSVIELSPDLHLLSYFAPTNWRSLDAGDVDLGSVGPVVMPSVGVVLAIGKQGVAYLLRMGHLGGIGGELASRPVCGGAWGGAAWSGSMVWIPCNNGLVALTVTATSLSVAWRASRPVMGSPILAAGAVWAIEPDTGTLYALDPASGAVITSVKLGAAQHFSTPAATEGYVVVPAGTRVVALTTGA